MKMRQLVPIAAMVAVLGGAAGLAQAGHMGNNGGSSNDYMMGPGGMGWGNCPGAGTMGGRGMMGPGMMMGQGAMGQGMMGPGMMGGGMMMGPGMMGPGMMDGGMMMGPGMMGGVYSELDLNKEQRDQINKIRSETRRKQWDLMGKIHDEQDKLATLLDSDTPDSAAIGKQYQRIQELQRQMLESSIDARNRMQAVLTPEQKDKLREFRRHYGMWG